LWSRDVARVATQFHDEVARIEALERQLVSSRAAVVGGALQNQTLQIFGVLTFNTQLLEGVLPGQAGRGEHLRARASVIAAQLLELGRGGAVDVVVLQEVWHVGAADVLRRALSPVFPHIHAPSAFCGLMVLSRRSHPHVHTAFTKFKAVEGIEGHWFSKGVSATVIELPPASVGGEVRGVTGEKREGEGEGEGRGEDRRCVVVLNTHTQSDFWKPCVETRARQFPVMLEILRGSQLAVEVPAGGSLNPRSLRRVCGAVLCGDLNVEAGSSEYCDMMIALEHGPDLLATNVINTYGSGGGSSDGDGGGDGSGGGDASTSFTFPLGRWSHSFFSAARCRYLRLEPTKRLDYVIDLTRLLRAPPSKDEAAPAVVPAASPAVSLEGDARYAHAHVLRGLAEDHRGDPLSDHVPVVAHLAF
jgi:hypothetical protein